MPKGDPESQETGASIRIQSLIAVIELYSWLRTRNSLATQRTHAKWPLAEIVST